MEEDNVSSEQSSRGGIWNLCVNVGGGVSEELGKLLTEL